MNSKDEPSPQSPMKAFVSRHGYRLVAATVLAISFAFRPSGLPGIPICWFKRFTSLPCPGCGLTRAFCSISHGAWAEAWAFNPFAFPLYLGVVLVLLVPALQWTGLLTDAGRERVNRIMLGALPVIVLLMFIFGVARLFFGDVSRL